MEKGKNFFMKLIEVLKTNPITLTTSAFGLGASGGVGYAVYSLFCDLNVDLPTWAMHLIVAVISILFACLTEWGILKKGWETPEQKQARLEAEAKQKEEDRIAKEAEAKAKAIADEEARLEAEALAVLEKEKALAAEREAEEQARLAQLEHDRRVQEMVDAIRAKQNN